MVSTYMEMPTRAADTPATPAETVFANQVDKFCLDLALMLKEKNRKYGDAALNPKRTFSKSSAIELLNARIDDKLSRIANAQTDEDEDPEWDLMGYLILKRIAVLREQEAKVDLNDYCF